MELYLGFDDEVLQRFRKIISRIEERKEEVSNKFHPDGRAKLFIGLLDEEKACEIAEEIGELYELMRDILTSSPPTDVEEAFFCKCL